MKNFGFKRSTKIAVAFMLLVSLVCLVGICSAATEEQTGLAVGKTNLEYNKNTHIIVTLEGEAPEGFEKGIAVWDYAVEGELTLANATFFNFDVETDAYGVEFYATQGIPAAALSEEYTIAPVTKDAEGNIAIAGELVKRSAFGYVEERLGDEGLMGYQVDLYRDLVVYGTSAEQVLGDKVANKNVVVAKNGYVGNAITPLQFVEDGTALLRAGVQNAKSEYFSHWEDAFGNFVTGERLVNVDVKAGLNYYNAVYTDKASSAYGGFADLNSFDTGKYNFEAITSKLTDANKTNGVAVIYAPMFGSFGFSSRVNFDNSDLTLEKLPITKEHDVLNFAENYDGTKYINYAREIKHTAETYQTIFNYESTDLQYKYERVEMDIDFNNSNNNAATLFYMNFHRDGGGYAKIYVALSVTTDSNNQRCICFHYYPQGQTKRMLIPMNGASVVTFGAEIDEAGVVNFYLDGEKIELEAPQGAYSGTLKEGTWHPAYMQIATQANATYNYDFYSIGLVDTDLVKEN